MVWNVMVDLRGRLLFAVAVGIFVGCSCSYPKLERGYRWYKRGATVHAVTLFDEYIREVDNAPREKRMLAVAYFYRGLCNSDLNKNEMARRDYKSALDLHPRYLYAAFNLGVEYMKIGDFKNAEGMMAYAWDIIKDVDMRTSDDETMISKSHLKKDKAFLFLYYGMLLLRANDDETFMSIRSAMDVDVIKAGNKDVLELYAKGSEWFNKNKQKLVFEDWYDRTFRQGLRKFTGHRGNLFLRQDSPRDEHD
jgi:tetratricopeptide (TPR) repeat protein